MADNLAAVTAVAHAQFETIHPFADGNGRIGRVLIGWLLTRRLGVGVPPPMSVQFARDIGGYLSGLVLFREDPQHDRWVSWFAEITRRAATEAGNVIDALAERGIVTRAGPVPAGSVRLGRPPVWWIATDLLALLTR